MRRIIFILFVFASVCLEAQNVHFNTLTTADGLSANTVYCSFRDHLGFLWIGTEDGLNRYDGNNFTVYYHNFSDSSSLASNIVFSATEDPVGNIWLGTATGVSCWNRNNGKFRNYFVVSDGKDQSVPIAKINFENDGNLYAYSLTGNGTIYELDQAKHILVKSAFMEDEKNNLKGRMFWINPGQTGFITDTSFSAYNFSDKKFSEKITAAENDRDHPLEGLTVIAVQGDSVYFTNWNAHNIVIFDCAHREWSEKKLQQLPPQTHLTFLLSAASGHWWLGAYDQGIIDFDPHTKAIEFYKNDPSKNNSWKGTVTFDYYTDVTGTIWFSTNEGLNFTPASSFAYHFLEKDANFIGNIHLSVVNDIKKDNKNNLWIGQLDYGDNTNGILYYNTSENTLQQFENKNAPDPYNGNLVWGLLPLDSLVVVSTQTGTIGFDPSTGHFQKINSNSIPQDILSSDQGLTLLYRDHENDLWFGLWRKGIVQFDPSTKSENHYSLHATENDKKISGENIRAFAEDSIHKKIWFICRDDNQLNCIDASSHAAVIYPVLLHGNEPDKTFSSLTVDPDGNVWIGTLDNGIILFNTTTKQCSQIAVADGLPSQTIYNCLSDAKNKVWIYTPEGIAWIDTKTHSITSLHDTHLPSSFNFDEAPMLLSDNGNLYFGNDDHIMYFNTKDAAEETRIDAPIITSVIAEDSEKELENNICTLHPDENYFTVQFVTPDLLRGKEIQYSYQLMSYDPGWVSTGNKGEAHFNHIPPGTYRLELRAQMSGQPWDGKFTSLNLQILPAYYQTWWFKLLLFILGAAFISVLFYAYFSRRIARLKREQQIQSIRTRIAQDIHDDIGSGLTKIFIRSEISSSKTNSDEVKNTFEEISIESRELVGKLGEVIWSADPKHDDLDSMLAYFRNYVHHFLTGLDIQYEILFPEKPEPLSVHPDVRRNLFLILKEALNNAVKHAEAKKIIISFSMEKEHYELKISDDGKGLHHKETKSPGSGNGLLNMQNRAIAIYASIAFEDADPHGLIITIKGKLKI